MPPKNKPDTSGLDKLKKDLSTGKPGQLYIFHGEETYLRDHYLSEAAKKLVPPAFAAFNAHKVEGKGLTVEALTENRQE